MMSTSPNREMTEWDLPPRMASQGGVIFNGEHIAYWEKRAKEKSSELLRLREALERIKAVSAKEGRTIAWAKAVASEALRDGGGE
jgi:hypothetical protein